MQTSVNLNGDQTRPESLFKKFLSVPMLPHLLTCWRLNLCLFLSMLINVLKIWITSALSLWYFNVGRPRVLRPSWSERFCIQVTSLVGLRCTFTISIIPFLYTGDTPLLQTRMMSDKGWELSPYYIVESSENKTWNLKSLCHLILDMFHKLHLSMTFITEDLLTLNFRNLKWPIYCFHRVFSIRIVFSYV